MEKYKFTASVIIPTYNRSNLLRMTLNSILKQNIDLSSFEIIVCDDGSKDDTKELIKEYYSKINIKYFYQEDIGFNVAQARNMGISNAEGEVCIFIDSGIIVDMNFIENHIKAHKDGEKSVVIGYMCGFDTSNKNKNQLETKLNKEDVEEAIIVLKEGGLVDERELVYNSIGENLSLWPAPWVVFWTCNVSVKHKFLLDVGGFDTNYTTWGGEDVDLAISLYLKEGIFKLAKEAIGVHFPHEKSHDLEQDPESFYKKGLEKRRYMYEKYGLHEILIWHNIPSFELNKVLLKNKSLRKGNVYKLLLTDMDGTLLNNDSGISVDTVNAINAAKMNGKKIAISSGRSVGFIKNFLQKYSLSLDIIALNGAQIMDELGNVLYESIISEALIRSIIEQLNFNDTIIKVYTKDSIFINNPKNLDEILKGFALFRFKDHLRIEEGKGIYRKNLYEDTVITDEFKETLTNKNLNVCKIEILTTDQQLLEDLRVELNKLTNITVSSSYINNIEITNSNVNKGTALRILADYLGVDTKETIAVGDHLNDIEMLKVSGLSVAMANSHLKVIEEAQYVTKSNIMDGVAYIINKFLK